MHRRLMAALILGGALAGGAGHSAASAAPLGKPLYIDTDAATRYGSIERISGPRLADGRLYVATVSGTLSYYAASSYSHPRRPWPIVCGTPERLPVYPSFGRVNGPVGIDAETVFARPWTRAACRRHPLPIHWNNFRIRTNDFFVDRDPIGGAVSVPTANHTYRYLLPGRGKRVGFMLKDINVGDNYGRLKIVLQPATDS